MEFYHIWTSELYVTGVQEGFVSTYPKDSPFKMDINVRKYNRTNFMHEINTTVTDTIDSRYYIKIEAQTWGDGGWKRNFVRYENYDPCKQFHFFFGKGTADFFEQLGMGRKCPFRPGNYYVNDVLTWNEKVPFDIFVGRARLIMIISKYKKEWVLTLAYTVNVVEHIG